MLSFIRLGFWVLFCVGIGIVVLEVGGWALGWMGRPAAADIVRGLGLSVLAFIALNQQRARGGR